VRLFLLNLFNDAAIVALGTPALVPRGADLGTSRRHGKPFTITLASAASLKPRLRCCAKASVRACGKGSFARNPYRAQVAATEVELRELLFAGSSPSELRRSIRRAQRSFPGGKRRIQMIEKASRQR
jgi:hypothetical protein